MNTASPQPSGLLKRVVGMIWSPRATFAEVVAHPVWIGMLIVIILVPAISGAVLFSTEVAQRALVEQQVQSMVDLGLEVADEQYEQMSRFAPFAAGAQFAALLVAVPVITVVTATLLFVISSAFLGGAVAFKQIYSVVVHAGVVSVVQALFVGPLNYLRGEMSNPTTLAALVPMLNADTFVVRFLGVIDVFIIWQIVLLAMGVAVATGRRTPPIAVGLLSLYMVVAIGIAFAITLFAG